MPLHLSGRLAAPHAHHLLVRVLKWIGVSAAGLSLLLVVVGAVLTQTSWGRGQLLRRALPLVQAQLLGKIRVGGLSGSVLGGLVLTDVELRDTEGVVAVSARRVAASYRLLALRHKRVELGDVTAAGVFVHARPLQDGTLNLLRLKKPAEHPGPLPVTIAVRRAQVDAELLYEGPLAAPGQASGQPRRIVVGAGIRAEAAAVVAAGSLDVRLQRLDLDLSKPLSARVTLQGHALLSGDGPLRRGAVTLTQLTAGLGEATLTGSGSYMLPSDWEVHLLLDAPSLARALGAVPPEFELPQIEGGLSLRAVAHGQGGRIGGDASLLARDLRVPWGSSGAQRLEMGAHVEDALQLVGRVQVDTSQAAVGGVRLRSLRLVAAGDGERATLRANGDGPDGASLRLDLRGAPRQLGDRPLALDLVLHELYLSARGRALRTQQPARLHIGSEVRVAGLALASGAQRLGLDGRYDRSGGAMDVDLRAQRLDLSMIGEILGLKRALPRTALDLRARADGSVHDPRVRADLSGTIAPMRLADLTLARTQVRMHAQTGGRRLTGDLDLHGNEQLTVRFAAPLSIESDAPLLVDVRLSGLQPQRYRLVLPDSLQDLSGTVGLEARLAGTLRRPEMQASVTMPSWSLGQLQQSSLRLGLSYREAALDVSAQLRLLAGSTMARDRPAAPQERLAAIGTLDAHVQVPVDLDPLKRPMSQLSRVVRGAPLSGLVSIKGLDLQALRLALPPLADTPIKAGRIDGNVQVTGTFDDPHLGVGLIARGLAAADVDEIDVSLQAALDGDPAGRSDASLQVWLRGGALLRAEARAPGLLQRIRERQPLRDQPLSMDAFVPAYDLARATQFGGRVVANALVRGTPGRPDVRAQARVDGLRSVQTNFGTVQVQGDATYDGTAAAAQLEIREGQGGRLSVRAQVPVARAAPWQIDAIAQRFVIDLRGSGAVTAIRSAHAQVDGEVHLRGSRAQPEPAGSLQVRDGALALAADPTEYRDVRLDLRLQRGELTLRELSMTSTGGGIARLAGVARLQGASLQRADAHLTVERFPAQRGGAGFWLDARADLSVDGGRPLRARVSIPEASVRLPQLAMGKKLQPLEPLQDVRFVDRRAQREEAKQAARAGAEVLAEIAVQAPGVNLRSGEISSVAQADLVVVIAPPQVRLRGAAGASGGWVEILGRRYNIDRARAGFSGEAAPDPTLDVRLTRQAPSALLVLEAHGTAKRPELRLTSEPPIYDQSQVIAMVLNGDPGQTQGPERGIDQRVVGALSGLILGQLKSQLAAQLPVDVLKVDVGSEGYTGLADTRLEVGKYLSDDLYISYMHQFGSQTGTRRRNTNQASLEYRFLRSYNLVTMFGDAGVGSLDLYWRRQF